MATKIATRTPRAASKRTAIVELAISAFAKEGYQSTSLRDIGDSAGMTAASFYYHFPSKEDLLRHIIVGAMDRLAEIMMRELSNDDGLEARFRSVLHAHILFTYENADETKIIADESRFLSPANFEPIRARHLAILNIYRNLIEGMQRAKLMPESDVTISAFLILSTINGFVRWFRPGRKADLGTSIDATIDYIFGGISR